MSSATVLPRKGKPRGFRRDRDCITCKRRNVKCDLNRPSCSPCQEARIKCEGYQQRVKWTTATVQTVDQKASQARQSPESSASGQSESASQQSSRRPFELQPLPFWYEVEADWSKSHVKYLQFVASDFQKGGIGQNAGQLCQADSLHDDYLLNVWGFVWKRFQSYIEQDRDHEVDFLLSRSAAINGLNAAIKKNDIEAIFGIVTFAFLGVVESPFGGWQCHLVGARALLDIHCKNRDELNQLYSRVQGLKKAISLLNWYDVIGAVVLRRCKLIFEDWHRADYDSEFFQLVSCPRDTFLLFVKIIDHSMVSEEVSEDIFYHAMDQLLQLSGNKTDQDLILHDAWICAAAIAVVSRGSEAQNTHRKEILKKLLTRSCEIIKLMSPQSPKYRHLAGPAYITGVNASMDDHREVVKQYWVRCKSFPFPLYAGAQAACESHWKTSK